MIHESDWPRCSSEQIIVPGVCLCSSSAGGRLAAMKQRSIPRSWRRPLQQPTEIASASAPIVEAAHRKRWLQPMQRNHVRPHVAKCTYIKPKRYKSKMLAIATVGLLARRGCLQSPAPPCGAGFLFIGLHSRTISFRVSWHGPLLSTGFSASRGVSVDSYREGES